MTDSQDKGYEFEQRAAKALGLDSTARSGAHWDDGDLKHPDFVIECKYKSQPNLTFPKNERTKLQEQAKRLLKDWIYLQSNNSGDYAVMSLKTLEALLDEIQYHKNRML